MESIFGKKIIASNFGNNEKKEINKITNFLINIKNTFIPRLSIISPSWIPVFIKNIIFGGNSQYYPDYPEIQDSTCIIYINGILTAKNQVLLNDKYILKKLLNRSVNIIHNETDSIISDLIESAIGKLSKDFTEISLLTLHLICKKMLDDNIKKIVIICYSQGTIIMANVLSKFKILGLDKEKFLKKLEIYAIANCATKMNYIIDKLPYIENFANENDFVAKMGCNCNSDIKDLVSIDGKIFINKNGSGHFLYSHYIHNFVSDYPESKLLEYILP